MCELRRVVVDVCHQDVDGRCGIEAWVSLVRHHHLKSMLGLLLPVQSHPVYDLTYSRRKAEKEKESKKREHTSML